MLRTSGNRFEERLLSFGTEEVMATTALPAMSSTPRSAHQLEADVRRALTVSEGLDIGSLVVRRLPDGICLEGVVRVSGDDFDVCRAVREIEGVGEVVNRLVICWNCPEPLCGTHEEMLLRKLQTHTNDIESGF